MGKWINYSIMITVSLADNIFPDKKDGGGRLKEDSDVMMTRLETHTAPEGCSPSRNFFRKGDDSALSCLALCVWWDGSDGDSGGARSFCPHLYRLKESLGNNKR